jgi:hypothetical protein
MAGRTAIKEHRLEEACSKFQASAELERAAATLLNLAACREAQGRTASAWSYYEQGRELSFAEGNSDGVRLADERLRALEPVLCRLVLLTPPNGPAGLRVEVDSKTVAPAALGLPQPVDPGTHVVRASAPGSVAWSVRFDIFERGEVRVVTLPVLEPLPESRRFSARTVDSAARPLWPLYTTGAVAGAAVLAAGYFGLLAASEWSTRNRNCIDGVCNRAALEASDRAALFARIADESAALGVLAGAAAVYFAVTHQSAPRSQRGALKVDLSLDRTSVRLGGEL